MSGESEGWRRSSKAQQGRRTETITRLQPAGRAAMKKKVERQAFGRGRKGDEAWAASTRDAAAGFVIATRQASTTFEHVSYMLEWNELLEKKGFGTHVLVRAVSPSLDPPDGGPSSPGIGASRRSPLPRLSSAERPAFVGHARRFSRACKQQPNQKRTNRTRDRPLRGRPRSKRP